jgi:hypothetical protein
VVHSYTIERGVFVWQDGAQTYDFLLRCCDHLTSQRFEPTEEAYIRATKIDGADPQILRLRRGRLGESSMRREPSRWGSLDADVVIERSRAL